MDSARDLSQVELWEESLQRSRERRTRAAARSRRRSVELGRLGPVGLGGAAAAVMAATLPSLLGGRGAQHGRPVAFKLADGSKLVVAAGGSDRLAASRPARRQVSAITTGPEHVVPSEHFVSTARQPAVSPHTTSVVAQTTTGQAQATPVQTQTTAVQAQPPSDRSHSGAATGQTFLAARRSHPNTASTAWHQSSVTEATLARAQSSAHHRPASGDGGAAVRGVTHSSRQHQAPPSHTSGGDSGQNRSGSTSHSSSGSHSGSSSHSSSAPSHSSAQSGGAAIHRPSSGSSHHSAPGGYVNPLAHASVTPERIDQGVDYSGSGPLDALGDGQITYVGTANTGWPGAFVEYRLLDGPDAGRYVYYAESVTPVRGLHVGEHVSAGQQIVTIYNGSSGIEIGWGAGIGTESYAMQHGQWGSHSDSNNVATPAGKNFSALIASLGGPPGKVEG